MSSECVWCNERSIVDIEDQVYWELPDGSRSIEITATPSLFCSSCHAVYLDEKLAADLEDQLFLIDRNELSSSISFSKLMALPKMLKKNYFNFKSE
ncbi:putative YokU family protein [Peribacillus deserti]|uniref:YokU family protein n=1 Tax=Peribacillus deserti TaxID=673318 RepID=A0ABS2QHA7_9BACI|nr:YokU family protein [Peribacillus deserti]MBM7692527.1 putative YokU family protein [Peribacillus deserti]